jgi:hypothetical protein
MKHTKEKNEKEKMKLTYGKLKKKKARERTCGECKESNDK